MTNTAERSDLRVVLEPLPPVDNLEYMWTQVDDAGEHSFFLSWTWIGTWLRVLPAFTRPALLRVVRRSETRALALVVERQTTLGPFWPLRQLWLNSTGDPSLDCITIEHNGFASAEPWADEVYPALLRWFAVQRHNADELVLPGIDVIRQAHSNRWMHEFDRYSKAYTAPLLNVTAGSGIEPLLSRNARQQLRRAIRACEGEGPLTLHVAEDVNTALDYFDRMKKLHIRSWTRRGRRHAFTNSFFDTFHRRLIEQGFVDGNVDLMRVSAGDRALGYLYNFRRKGVVSSYQSGFDDTEPNFRPGYVSHALAMAYYAGAGMLQYDFLAGENQLKQSFGPQHYQICWRRVRSKTVAWQIDALARRLAGMFRREP